MAGRRDAMNPVELRLASLKGDRAGEADAALEVEGAAVALDVVRQDALTPTSVRTPSIATA